jgi:hypothetical protein
VRALVCPLFAWSSWVQIATKVAGTAGEASALASVRSDGVGQPLLWRERQLRALVCPLFDGLACALAPTVVAGATVEGVALAHVRSVCVGTESDCDGGPSQPLW